MSIRRFAFPGTNIHCEKIGLRPISIGMQTLRGMQGVHFRRTLPDYQFVILLRGEYFYESALTRECKVSAPAAFFTFPGIWHRYGTRQGIRSLEFYARFDGFLPRHYCDHKVMNPARPIIPLRDFPRVKGFCHDIVHGLERPKDRHMEYAAQGLLHLLQELFIQYGPVLSQSEDRNILQMVRAMRMQLCDFKFDLKTYCQTQGIGFESFRKMFKQRTGYPPQAYFFRLKITLAKEQLAWTDLPIKAIAHATGFSDPYYFSRVFKQYEKLSPKSYRDICREQINGLTGP